MTIRQLPTFASTYRPYTGDAGIYVSRQLDAISVAKLVDFVHKHRICQVSEQDAADMHCTIVWSPNNIVVDVTPIRREYTARCIRLEAWPGHNNEGYLVAILDSQSLSILHKTWKMRGAQHSFPDYVPHVTIKTPFAYPLDDNDHMWKLLRKARESLESSPMIIRLVQESVQNAKQSIK